MVFETKKIIKTNYSALDNKILSDASWLTQRRPSTDCFSVITSRFDIVKCLSWRSEFVQVAKYGGGSESRLLFTEDDLERSMDKIEVWLHEINVTLFCLGLSSIPKFSRMIKISLKVIDFHEQKEVNGVRFWPYVAGHVLGACMFMIEIAGVKILYTGQTNSCVILIHYIPKWITLITVVDWVSKYTWTDPILQVTSHVWKIVICVLQNCPRCDRMFSYRFAFWHDFFFVYGKKY